MWQKFFLLFRIAMISPHCSNTSTMICSVPFSGRPPTNTVLHPGGLSRVAGGGRSKFKGKIIGNKNICLGQTSLKSDYFFFRDSLIVSSKTLASLSACLCYTENLLYKPEKHFIQWFLWLWLLRNEHPFCLIHLERFSFAPYFCCDKPLLLIFWLSVLRGVSRGNFP